MSLVGRIVKVLLRLREVNVLFFFSFLPSFYRVFRVEERSGARSSGYLRP